MELRVSEVKLPEAIVFNYEELKKELTEKVSMYANLVYTDEQIRLAKADKANLNKLKKALNDERIRREKEYMQPFNEFKAQINEIISIIDKPVAAIDIQVKEYEERQKIEKQMQVEELFTSIGFQPFVKLDMIFDPKWLNATVTLRKIEEQMRERMYGISTDLLTLSGLTEFSLEATEVYKTTLDINKAINEGKRLSEIARAKAEHEAEQARLKAEIETETRHAEAFITPPVTEDLLFDTSVEPALEKQWVSFRAYLSILDALELKEFFNVRNIDFKPI